MCVHTMDEASRRLGDILAKGEQLGVKKEDLVSMCSARKLHRDSCIGCPIGLSLLVIAVVVCLSQSGTINGWRPRLDSQCAIDTPDWMHRAFRPPEDCTICRDVHNVERIANISSSMFEERYAYSGRPVVVTDAMRNWTAPSLFSFDFFKTLYIRSPQPGCQFFPYETQFGSLVDVFNMSEQRAALHGKPWYVGWSNCDERVARVLRKHYSRPYFLPSNAETKQLDWIFMGSPGYGAHMHVDNVGHASWQAQLRGHKQWMLQPPPECIYHCQTLTVTLQPGDIIVLDTNRWYHKTLIVSEEMSITIGAEYD